MTTVVVLGYPPPGHLVRSAEGLATAIAGSEGVKCTSVFLDKGVQVGGVCRCSGTGERTAL